MFERFTDRARRVLVLAQEEARLLNHSFIGTEHILLGLIHEGGVAANALESLNISLEAVRTEVGRTIGPAGTGSPTGSPPFTPRAKRALELALREALQLGHSYIGTEHLLLGLIRDGEGVAAQVLQSLGASLPQVQSQVISRFAGNQVRPQPSGELAHPAGTHNQPIRVLAGPEATLVADGVQFRAVGVHVFDDSIRILWRLSGIPGPVDELLRAPALRSRLRGAPWTSMVDLTDDRNTSYLITYGTFDPQRNREWVGETDFTPGLSEGVRTLKIQWQDQVLEVYLDGSS